MEHGAGRDGALRLSVATAGLPAGARVRVPRPAARRWFEWGLLGALLLVLIVWLMHEGRKVQAQAELAAVQTTLGALRTAAILRDLQARTAAGAPGAPPPGTNPFDLLQTRPPNYLGALDAAQALGARAGSWHHDAACGCVVYVPLDPHWLVSASGAQAMRFRVRAGAGPLQLEPLEPYWWQGRRVD